MGVKNVTFNPSFLIIGHRGHVSRYPENSIQGFLSAVGLGVDGLEMDLVISADKEVVVSHEPYMAASKVLTPDGNRIPPSVEKDYNLYKMTYESIRRFSMGPVDDSRFRHQKRIRTYKPLLSEIFKAVVDYRQSNNLPPITYFLEVKSKPTDYGIFQPHPEELAALIMGTVKKHEMQEAVIIQSFDEGFLNILKHKYPEVKTSYLIHKTTFWEALRRLNFTPDVIGPYYKQLKTIQQVEELHALGYKVIPWTINSKKMIKELIGMGVDGIITDYPERALSLKKE